MTMPPLPDPSDWKPTSDSQHIFRDALSLRCSAVEKRLLSGAQYESTHAVHGFESGQPFEEQVRVELGALLPRRYHLRPGVVCDENGSNAGECDLVIYNDFWVPQLKHVPTSDSRRAFLPIEGVYGVIEIKQTLTWQTFDEAMKKLVSVLRLERPMWEPSRSSENRTSRGFGSFHVVPVYSMIFAGKLGEGVTLKEIAERFFWVNHKIERSAVVRGVCVLSEGFVGWGRRISGEIVPAFFLEDVHEPLVPTIHDAAVHGTALMPAFVDLWTGIHSVILQPDMIPTRYSGSIGKQVKAPKDPSVILPPLKLLHDEDAEKKSDS